MEKHFHGSLHSSTAPLTRWFNFTVCTWYQYCTNTNSIHTFYTSRPTWYPGTVRVYSLHKLLHFLEGRLDFICYTWFPFSWHEQANKMCYISQIILFPIFFISLRNWEKNLHNRAYSSRSLNSVTTSISTVNVLFHIAEKWLGISSTKD